jgi:6-phosphogluconolactonase
LSPPEFRVFPTAADVATAAASHVAQAAATAIARRGAFHLVLAGGNTPREVYRRLVALAADWSRWHVWFGDERCLPPDHPDRNSNMASDTWLSRVPIPQGQIHTIPTELGATAAAAHYAEAVEGVTFDLVLLGLGEEGHTASLFPGHDWGATTGAAAVLAVHDAPKPPRQRVSLSARKLSETREVSFLVTGEAKREAIARWEGGETIPAAAIRAPTIAVWMDAAAASSGPAR